MHYKMVLILLVIILIWSCDSGDNSSQTASAESQVSLHGAEMFHYEVPENWIEEKPQSPMRKAQFRWPGAEGEEDAEMALFHFPGTGGSIEQNLDRWFGQFSQPDGSDSESRVQKMNMTVDGMKVTVVYLSGTYLKSTTPMMSGPVEEKPDYAMLAAILESPDGPWFFKSVGPEKTIDFWRDEFNKFIQTVNWR